MAEALMQDQALPEATHQDMANAIRALAMDAVQKADSGHPGMPMGMADVATVLFTRFLKFDAAHPDWPDRDRFVLSAGHGSMLLYALLYLTGYPEMELDELKNFRQLGSRTPGHPEYGHAPGIETTTGPLGQGLGNAVGMALAERLLNRRYGDEIVSHHTYCVVGDGCLMEGISHEAISLAGHLKLGRLIVLFDDNQISIDGPTSLSVSDDQIERFKASGWHTARVNGHDPEAVALAIENAKQVTDRPSLIACRTVIGFGAPSKAGTAATHGSPLGEEEIKGAREKLFWRHQPFEVPKPILASWRAAGTRHRAAYDGWAQAAKRLDAEARAGLTDPIDDKVRGAIVAAIAAVKSDFTRDNAKLATRQSSQKVLEKLLPVVPGLVGGSADLTGSNGTLTKQSVVIKPGEFAGNYLHYGVREHGMAAAMNGLALHGGIVPYGGTFLVFSDYCRPSIRLSALMQQRVVYVMTHDSIGLGEDGPTHQPVEHLGRAPRHSQSLRDASGQFDRMRRMLGDCAARRAYADDPGAHPPRAAGAAHDPRRGQSLGQGRLCADRGERQARRDLDRHGLGAGSRRPGGQGARGRGDRRRRRLHAVLRAVRGAGGELPERRTGFGAARGGRGRGRVRLGTLAWARRRLYRHARIRRFSPGARPI